MTLSASHSASDLMVPATSLPNALPNLMLRAAIGYERFVMQVLSDMRENAAKGDATSLVAKQTGRFVVTRSTDDVTNDGSPLKAANLGLSKQRAIDWEAGNPVDLGEIVGDGGFTSVYTTEASADAFYAPMRRLYVLAQLAGRVAHLNHDNANEQCDKIAQAMRGTLAQLGNVDRDLWNVYASGDGKQHMSGVKQGLAEIDGSHNTRSLRGNVTEIRYNPTAAKGIRAHKASHVYASATGYVSTRDMRA